VAHLFNIVRHLGAAPTAAPQPGAAALQFGVSKMGDRDPATHLSIRRRPRHCAPRELERKSGTTFARMRTAAGANDALRQPKTSVETASSQSTNVHG